MRHPADDDAPELTQDVLKKARAGRDVLPEAVLAQFKRSPGRPPVDAPKVPVSIRLDADVLSKLKEGGPGWQSRANGILRQAMLPTSKARA